jgi:hypothetical protein
MIHLLDEKDSAADRNHASRQQALAWGAKVVIWSRDFLKIYDWTDRKLKKYIDTLYIGVNMSRIGYIDSRHKAVKSQENGCEMSVL